MTRCAYLSLISRLIENIYETKKQVSGQEASSRTVSSSSVNDLSNIANTGIYGFEDYHGIDIGVVRAVRVWYVPNFSEVSVRLKVEDEETRIGVGISQNEEVK